MVFYDYGTLTTWVNSKKSKSLYEAFKIFKGIVSPVMALHCYGIVHNDIKPANILLSVEPDGNLCPKLTDFGISQIVDSTTLKVKAFKSSHVEGWSTRYCPPGKQ